MRIRRRRKNSSFDLIEKRKNGSSSVICRVFIYRFVTGNIDSLVKITKLGSLLEVALEELQRFVMMTCLRQGYLSYVIHQLLVAISLIFKWNIHSRTSVCTDFVVFLAQLKGRNWQIDCHVALVDSRILCIWSLDLLSRWTLSKLDFNVV